MYRKNEQQGNVDLKCHSNASKKIKRTRPESKKKANKTKGSLHSLNYTKYYNDTMTVRHRSISAEWQKKHWKQLRKLNKEFMVLMPEQTQRRKKKTSEKTPLRLDQQTRNQKNPKTNKIQLLEATYPHFSWQRRKITVLFFNLCCMFVHAKHNAVCMGDGITM